LQWNKFSSGLQDALSAIIHSSSLETLHLKYIELPITLFQGIRLKKLVLESVPLSRFGGQSALLTGAVDRCEWICSERSVGARFPANSLIFPHPIRRTPTDIPAVHVPST
jgi:hypothetical protein